MSIVHRQAYVGEQVLLSRDNRSTITLILIMTNYKVDKITFGRFSQLLQLNTYLQMIHRY